MPRAASNSLVFIGSPLPVCSLVLCPVRLLEAVERDRQQQHKSDDDVLPEHADAIDDEGVLDESDQQPNFGDVLRRLLGAPAATRPPRGFTQVLPLFPAKAGVDVGDGTGLRRCDEVLVSASTRRPLVNHVNDSKH